MGTVDKNYIELRPNFQISAIFTSLIDHDLLWVTPISTRTAVTRSSSAPGGGLGLVYKGGV